MALHRAGILFKDLLAEMPTETASGGTRFICLSPVRGRRLLPAGRPAWTRVGVGTAFLFQHLCAELAAGRIPREIIPVAQSRLVVTAEPLAVPDGAVRVVSLAVALEVPRRLRFVEGLMALDLSPRQRSLLLAAASGETRAAAAPRTRTSAEAMKKHLATIYDATGLRSWADLARYCEKV